VIQWVRRPARWVGADPLGRSALALALVPFVVAAVRAVRTGWFPIGDSALLYIRAADTFTAHHPWLGSWTSASQSVGRDMNNPGAMYDWLLAPFAHLLPPGPGAAIGVAAINAVSVVGIACAARHVGGRSFERVMIAVSALLAWSMGSELLIDIWQAHALLLPFVLLLVLLVGVAGSRDRCLPWAAAVASLLVQTHISYAYVLVLLGVAVVALRVMAVRRDGGGSSRRSVVHAVAVTVVLWLPSVGEQLFGEGEGNLARLAKSAGGGDLTLGFGNALGAVAAVFVRPWWWLRPGFSSTVPSTPVEVHGAARSITLAGVPPPAAALVGIVALTAVLLALAWWGRRREQHMVATTAILAALLPSFAVVCLSALTVGPAGLAAHHVRWIWPAAAFVHAVAAWCVWSLVRGTVLRVVPHRVLSAAWLAAVATVVVASIPVVAHPEGPTADRAVNPVLEEAFAALDPLEGIGPVRYDTDTLRVFEPYSSAVMMELQARGIEFRVSNEGMVRQLGNRRRASGDERVTVFQLEGIDALRYSGDACVLAVAMLLDPVERLEAERSGRALEALVADGVGIPAAADALSAEDRDVLTRAAVGEVAAVESLVYRGVLARALRAGAIEFEAAQEDEVLATAALVDRWVSGAFALLATLPPVDCPA
jgi:hypothetical protein